jgi:hypothetical protein
VGSRAIHLVKALARPFVAGGARQFVERALRSPDLLTYPCSEMSG